MAAVTTAEDADAQRRERVKARWSMLRQALLGSSSGGGGSDVGSEHHSKGTANNISSNDNKKFHEHSMNFFPGFHVLDRTILPREGRDAFIDCNGNDWNMVQNSYTSTKGHEIRFLTREAQQEQQRQTNEQSTIQSRVEALMSHRNYGVDNTGNVRVWDAEATLAGFCLSVVLDGDEDDVRELEGDEQALKLSDLKRRIRCAITNDSPKESEGGNTTFNLLELGAGQAGLAGLAVAAASVLLEGHAVGDNRKCMEGLSQMKPLNVVLTDGHPKCVDNNETCAKMMSKSENLSKFQIEARLLLWDSSSKGAFACRQINNIIGDLTMDQCENTGPSESNCEGESVTANISADEGLYQLCLASDCVHFQEFHDGLFATIARTLVVGGIALLCQPKRGTSLPNFMVLVDAVNASEVDGSISNDDTQYSKTNDGNVIAKGPLFQMNLFEDFDTKVSAMHTTLLSESKANMKNVPNAKPQCSSQYDPNRHRPLLLVLQKLRLYDEDLDGELARYHVKMRVM